MNKGDGEDMDRWLTVKPPLDRRTKIAAELKSTPLTDHYNRQVEPEVGFGDPERSDFSTAVNKG